jgi:ankyrin repeat protein
MNAKVFIQAIRNGDEPAVREMLEAAPNLAASRDTDGVSAVLIAQYHGKAAIAKLIAGAKGSVDIFEASALGDRHRISVCLNDGEDVNGYNADGFTPLGLAAYFGNLEIVELLLSLGADPNIPSRNDIGVLPLHSALASAHKAIARALIKANTDVNFPSAAGWTPLRYTAETNDLETACLLLENGAEPSAADIKAAYDHGFVELANQLREGGCSG